MRRSLLRGSKVVIDRAPDILVKSYSPNQRIENLTLVGTDVVIKEEVSGNILWSNTGEGELQYGTQLPISAQHIDIRITAKKLKRIAFSSSISQVKYFRVNSGCNILDCFSNCGWLTSVSGMNIDNLNDASRLFYNCQALETVEPFSIKSSAKLREAFYLCSKITTCPVINLEEASDLYGCFISSGLTSLTNISNRALKATNVDNFLQLTKLTEVSGLTFLNATNVIIGSMPSLTGINNITANKATKISFVYNELLYSVTDIFAPMATQVLFTGDLKLEVINNIQIHPDGLTSGEAMFTSCSSLTFLPAFNYSLITNASRMFAGCRLLENFGNLNPQALTNTTSMFSSCTSLVSIPSLNYSNVTACQEMFFGCTGLTGEISITFGNAEYAQNLFSNCNKITKATVTFGYSSRLLVDNIFSECSSLQYGNVFAGNSNAITLNIPNGFFNCTELLEAQLPQIPASGNYQSTFENCYKLTGIPNGLANIGDFRKTFFNCKALTMISNMVFDSVLVSTYTQQVTIFSQTFAGSGIKSATNLTFKGGVAPGGYVDTLFRIGDIFTGCLDLETVSNIKVVVKGKEFVTYTISQFFKNCPKLTALIPITVEVEVPSVNRTLRTNNNLWYQGIVNYNDDTSIQPYNSILEFISIPTLKTVNLTLNCSSKDNKVEIAGFSSCPELESIVINNPNNYQLTNLYVYNGSWGEYAAFLSDIPKLTNLVLPGWRSHLAVPESITSTSVLEGLVNGLADNTGTSKLQIIMGTTRKNQLSQAVIDNATAKNWEIV